MKKTLFYVYAAMGAMNLLGIALQWKWLAGPSKFLLMPVLIAFYIASVSKMKLMQWIMVIALVFSFSGDVNLELTGFSPNFFLLGLASFLITHILYSFIFFQHKRNETGLLPKKPFLALPWLLYGFSLVSSVAGGLGDMKIPVMVYASVITIMVLLALNRQTKVNKSSFVQTFLGAVMFMMSDSVIALSRFSPLFEGKKIIASLIIMSLYIVGQFLIVNGILEQDEEGLKSLT